MSDPRSLWGRVPPDPTDLFLGAVTSLRGADTDAFITVCQDSLTKVVSDAGLDFFKVESFWIIYVLELFADSFASVL